MHERNDDPNPDTRTGSYSTVMGIYLAAVAGAALAARRTGVRLPTRFSLFDLALATVATWRVSRLLTKDTVTRPLREPFTEFRGVSGPSELAEDARSDTRWRHTIGELVSCPFCMSQWIATVWVAGLVIRPRVARLVMSLFAIIGVSDLMQDVAARVRA